MSKSTKAALLSAFVFPGVGHFYLKRPLTGAILAIVALAALYLVASSAMQTALQIAEQIQRGGVPLDMSALLTLVERQPAGDGVQRSGVASMGLLFAWLFGIVDCYRVGRKTGRKDDA